MSARVNAPVPAPTSSTRRGAPLSGSPSSIRRARARLLGTTAPMAPPLWRTWSTKTRRSESAIGERRTGQATPRHAARRLRVRPLPSRMNSVIDVLNAAAPFPLGDAALVVVPLLYAVGVATAVDAVMKSRTPQGSTAWMFALVAFPLVAVPLYWLVGRFTFGDYIEALGDFDDDIECTLCEALEQPRSGRARARAARPARCAPSANWARSRSRAATAARLLVDGEATFDAVFAAIDAAEHVRPGPVLHRPRRPHRDGLPGGPAARCRPRRARAPALRRRRQPWRCAGRTCATLRDGGVEVSSFTGPRNWLKKLRLNFRNHRKIVVVDGRRALVGGPQRGRRVPRAATRKSGRGATRTSPSRGRLVQALQLSFARDWFYARREELPGLEWEPDARRGRHDGARALVGPVGRDRDVRAALHARHRVRRGARSGSRRPTSSPTGACSARSSSPRCAASTSAC